MSLLVSQKDMFFDIIEKHKSFTPFQFKFEIFSNSGNILFEFKESGYYFKIFPIRGLASFFRTYYTPGESVLNESTSDIQINPDVYGHFSKWLDNIDREIKAPNKWERLRKEIDSMSISLDDSGNNEKFTFQEYTEVVNKIGLLKEDIKSIKLTTSEFNIINQKLDFLIEQAQTLKKFDWKSLFYGSIMNIATSIIVNQANINAFYEQARRIFSSLFLP